MPVLCRNMILVPSSAALGTIDLFIVFSGFQNFRIHNQLPNYASKHVKPIEDPSVPTPKKEKYYTEYTEMLEALGMLNLPSLVTSMLTHLPTSLYPDVAPLMLRNSGKEPAQLCHGSSYLQQNPWNVED